MIYVITRQSDEKEWIRENPDFVRYNTDLRAYVICPESNAHGVMIDGTAYHILGRAPIQGLDEVTVGMSSEEVYSNVEVTEKLNAQDTTNTSVSNNLDDLWVAVLEG